MKKHATMLDAMNVFLASDMRNAWMYGKGFEIYFRNSKRFLRYKGRDNTQYLHILDIATINVYPKFQNKGMFTEFLKQVRENLPLDGIMIENALTPYFADSLRKLEWDRIDENGPCFWLVKDEFKV